MKISLTPTLWSFGSICLLILSAGWIWISRVPAADQLDRQGFVPQKGFQAPDFTLSNLQGEPISLSDFLGKPVLVNYWASWCPPCKAEMPAMQRVYQDYAQHGFVILAVNATNQDDLTSAKNFAADMGITFTILFDPDGEVGKRYQVSALPTSFFIDPKGIIQEVIIGGPMSEALLRSRVDELLKP